MNAVHLHLALNHFPVVLVGVAVPLLAWALVSRRRDVATVTSVLLVGAALVVGPVYLLGEEAEEVVEHLPGVSEAHVEAHEEAATVAVWATAALGAFALGYLWLAGPGAPTRRTLAVYLALATVAAATLGWTAWEGGEIRHPEIRGSGSSQAPDG